MLRGVKKMFQNVSRDYTEDKKEININNKKSIKDIIKSIIKGQSIFLYAIALMLSCVDGIGLNYSLFSIGICAAIISNSIPVGIAFILTLVGTLIKFGTTGLLSYLFSMFILVGLILMFKPRKLLLEYESEKIKLGKCVFIAVFLGQAVKMMFNGFLVYDLLISITSGMTAYIFYKIFSKSLIVINEIRNKKVFSIEEVIGATLMVSIAATCFGNTEMIGLQISNIISILLVLILGWKNGI